MWSKEGQGSPAVLFEFALCHERKFGHDKNPYVDFRICLIFASDIHMHEMLIGQRIIHPQRRITRQRRCVTDARTKQVSQRASVSFREASRFHAEGGEAWGPRRRCARVKGFRVRSGLRDVPLPLGGLQREDFSRSPTALPYGKTDRPVQASKVPRVLRSRWANGDIEATPLRSQLIPGRTVKTKGMPSSVTGRKVKVTGR